MYLLLFALLSLCAASTSPKHVHLSLSAQWDEMNVVWMTESFAETSVQYGTDKSSLESKGQIVTGVSELLAYSTPTNPGYLHTATLRKLLPNKIYVYRVGGKDGWSNQFHFKTAPPPISANGEVNILAYGDMGVKWANSLITIQHLSPLARGLDIDLVLHAGDLAYAFGNFTIWNMWFERIQSVAAYVPYMISPGNRDEEQMIQERFVMPYTNGKPARHNFYYSFDFKWVHVVSISIKDDYKKGSDQYNWLQEDLKSAKERILNGNDIRWILLFGHTPLYSSSDGHTGGNKDLKNEIEGLLYSYGVTLAIWGDDHVYERSFPLYNDEPDTTFTYSDPNKTIPTFNSPNKTIHLLVGTAGIDLDGWQSEVPPSWSAYREKSNGFVNLEFKKSTCSVKFIRIQDGSIADEFLIVKPILMEEPHWGGDGSCSQHFV